MLKNIFNMFLLIISAMMLGSYVSVESAGGDISVIAWLVTYILLVLNGALLVIGLINYGKKMQ